MLDKPFDYEIGEELSGRVGIGSRVIVPFSKGNKEVEGFCVGLKEATKAKNLKSIKCLANQPQAFDEEMLELIDWMRDRYLATYLDVIHAVVPAGSAVHASEWLFIKDSVSSSSPLINQIAKIIIDNGGAMETDALEAMFEQSIKSQIRSMIKAGTLTKGFKHTSMVTAKTQKCARLLISGEEALREAQKIAPKAPVQAEVLRALSREQYISLTDLRGISSSAHSAVTSLLKKEKIEVFDKELERDPFMNKEFVKTSALSPTFEQKNAIERINHSVDSDKSDVFLLHGVTGSGKTEVFMQAIDHAIAMGKTALVLVPEISLTPQMVSRFVSRFGDKVAILHSALSMGERYDQWKRIFDGNADIVIGARSAVFAPLKNIGIIIIDEEHSDTYKSEMLPRYHAREVSIKRAEQCGAAVVLASATPSVESMYKARTGEYELLEMKKRYNENAMPKVYIADMRSELENGNKSMFSKLLQDEIIKNLKAGEQTILFLNRRGFSTFVSCRSCGYVPKCPNCNISLTYHRFDNRLKCHYCGYEHENYRLCPTCGSKYIRYFGGGTQKVEEEIKKTFPMASVIRMDVDTTGKKQSHEEIISRFEREKTDILIGTQMVAKGLDFENVTLVGVISADTMLHINDFRSEERTFAMLEQVSGRAGRGKKTGRAVIQTYTPENEAVSLAGSHDYSAFYESEILKRKLMWYPPYSDIICVMFSGISETITLRSARYFLKQLDIKNSAKTQILGPVAAAIAKMNNKYRYRIIIKCENGDSLNAAILKARKECKKHEDYKSVAVVVDKNPNMML